MGKMSEIQIRSDDNIFLENFSEIYNFWSLGLKFQVLGWEFLLKSRSRSFNQGLFLMVAISTTSLVWTAL